MNDVLNSESFEKETLPKRLNTLTILTFIGCSILGFFTLITPWFLKLMLNIMDKASANGKELNTKQIEDMQKGRAAIELSQINLVPLLIIGSVGIILCFVGAYMMRKLKKDGLWLYIAGQILPILGNLFLLGMSQFTGVMSYLFLAIPFVFIYLYYTQLKYLTK
jgi:hypothetical protein